MRALTDGGRRSLITFCFANVKTDDLRSPWLPLPTALLDLTVDVVLQIYSYTHRVNIVTSCQLSQQRCSALHHSSALVSDWLEGNSLANQNSGTNCISQKRTTSIHVIGQIFPTCQTTNLLPSASPHTRLFPTSLKCAFLIQPG